MFCCTCLSVPSGLIWECLCSIVMQSTLMKQPLIIKSLTLLYIKVLCYQLIYALLIQTRYSTVSLCIPIRRQGYYFPPMPTTLDQRKDGRFTRQCSQHSETKLVFMTSCSQLRAKHLVRGKQSRLIWNLESAVWIWHLDFQVKWYPKRRVNRYLVNYWNSKMQS